MKRIGLLSDTHGFLDEAVSACFKDCDEIWHAGDFGSKELVEQLKSFKPLRGVYGNIDGQEIRLEFPEILVFQCENVKVLMKHIGGYPPKYNKDTRPLLIREKPQLFINGHSHILKIMYDNQLQCLHMNPGAAGKQGWHQIRTLIRFTIDGPDIRDCEVIELKGR
ncbi:YfcE family phosphodiesterase [Niabella ginsenosidivorans]|uniref:YfcE family phosphodiesterase n=1 Tax=Niabella ginsenosidivorans TaxID=1176587 RepID=A0A1A9HXC8_9BACT|nr:metallophosphoesterase family protein [Niabella ginsenosidivorans]ANH79735.1 YfcE family phosphodiesterase [Niabella ginsenosidivorans]